jgi:Reductase C-terminal/Pyridine nucleotide-disulphide oxidoreductase
MTTSETFVIVGAGLTGAKAAETLRTEGFDGRLVLIGSGHERPYERPPLSKDYLRGEVGREQVYVHDEGYYAEHDIELRLGRTAVGLDTSIGQVALDDGMEYAGHAPTWDRVVVRGDPASREFIAFSLLDDRVVAGMNVGVWDVSDHIQSLIRTGATVDERRLADTDVPVEDLGVTTEAGAA